MVLTVLSLLPWSQATESRTKTRLRYFRITFCLLLCAIALKTHSLTSHDHMMLTPSPPLASILHFFLPAALRRVLVFNALKSEVSYVL